MKNKYKIISFSILLILILSLSIGCTPTDKDINNIEGGKIWMELGFLSDKYKEDNKQFVEIAPEGKTLELEILDDNLFNNLILDEYYMVSYNESKEVKSIEVNPFIKKLVIDSMEEDIVEESPVIISKSEKFDTGNLTLLDSYFLDIDKNGEDEKISMYTAAGRDSQGEIMWDDGQDWVILVEGKDSDYILFNDYVQIGSMQFFVYTIEDDVYISTITSSTANLKLKEYKFNRESEEFESSVKFTTQGNVIMLHSTK